MGQDITDANAVVIKVGESQAGGPNGTLILTDYEHGDDPDKTRQYGIGNRDAQGRTSGNRDLSLSFTHVGQNEALVDDIEAGNFDAKLKGDKYSWELDDADGSYNVSVSDGGEYEISFDGNVLSKSKVAVDGSSEDGEGSSSSA